MNILAFECVDELEHSSISEEDIAARRGCSPPCQPLYTVSSAAPPMRVKLERSRQSARECRARKKLRYQYLEELVRTREQANLWLRAEMERYVHWSREMDEGRVPEQLLRMIEQDESRQQQQQQQPGGQ